MAALRVFQSLWAMEDLPFGVCSNWTLEERVQMVADQNFDGMALSFTDLDAAQRVVRLLKAYGLTWIANLYPGSLTELREHAHAIAEIGAEHINVQPNIRPATVVEGVDFLEGLLAIEDEIPLDILVETHRDRLTTDLLFTLELLQAVPDVRLTADLSHYVVGREMTYPITDENKMRVEQVLGRSHAFHGRVASREQIQLQHSFSHHEPWLRVFAEWWCQGFAMCKARGGAHVWFTCELGPRNWYAMTDAHGRELSDRWAESRQLHQLARLLWHGADVTAALSQLEIRHLDNVI